MHIRRIPKPTKRSSRWRSTAHCNHVRSHVCCVCGAGAPIEVAHVRNGSSAGMGQKPDDFMAVPLCKDCHQKQHSQGEQTFWRGAGFDPQQVIDAMIKTSPKRREIMEARNG